MGTTAYGQRAVPGDPENTGRYDAIARSIRVDWELLDWWLSRADELSWRYASTMESTPHSYVIRDKTLPAEEYMQAFAVVRTFGTLGMFHGRPQIYLSDPDLTAGPMQKGRRWWLMSTHHWQSKSLNMGVDGRTYGRQDAPDTSRPGDLLGERSELPLYDSIGAFYEDLYRLDTAEDRTLLWKLMVGETNFYQPRTLDVGAGTGGTLISKATPAHTVTAIDPSQAMLNDLAVYHPTTHRILNATAAEYLEDEDGVAYDLIVASHGTASYLSHEEVHGLLERLSGKGRAIFTFYGQGTRVPVLEANGLAPEALPGFAMDLPGRTIRHGDFITYVIDKERR